MQELQELQSIYTQMVAAALTAPNHQGVADWAHQLSPKVAVAMVEVYTAMKSKFTVDDHEHYLFCPRDLTQWILQLLRYDVAAVEGLVEALRFEACRIFCDRLVGDIAQGHFGDVLKNVVMSSFNMDTEAEK